MTSSPLRAGASMEDELDYYKKQYEQLETDLADFQASSKELEEQLERDIEAAEKNERKLREQVEKLNFEVEEWKTKHKQSKTEANSAQNALQKEITTIRESNRAMQLKLRDIEVMNDDYERQARNTESSLEDMESKYNVAIERSVMLDEEMKIGEQEREALRIETQRLRDEFGDLKVESEITIEKLRLADETIERLRSRKPSPLAVEHLRARSPGSEASGITPSSPTASTPPSKSDSMSDAPTPPSPPLSDAPTMDAKAEAKTPLPQRRQSLMPDAAATPRPSPYGPRAALKHSRGPSMASSTGTSKFDARAMKPPATKPRHARPSAGTGESLPRSDSLHQIKALRGRMQKIEERVHSARSKLPPPGTRTPTGSPRVASVTGEHIPSSITMRRSMKRSSAISSLANGETLDNSHDTSSKRESRIKRLSYGIPRPPSAAAGERSPSRATFDRPPSATAGQRSPSRATFDRPPSAGGAGRPSSRASMASAANSRPGSRGGARPPSALGNYAGTTGTAKPAAVGTGPPRPSSRAGTGTTGALGHHARTPSTAKPAVDTGPARPRSSVGGNYATVHGTPRSHRTSASVSELRRKATESEDSGLGGFAATPSRRTTLERTALPTPTLSRRPSGGLVPTQKTIRRISTGLDKGNGGGEMRPPPSRRKMSDVGETY